MAVTTTNLGVITAYGDAVAAGYTGTKAEWQALMASYATVGQQAVDAKNAAVAAKDTAVAKATEATTAANTATTKASEASASAQSIAQSAAQITQNTSDISELKEDLEPLRYGNLYCDATTVNQNYYKTAKKLYSGNSYRLAITLDATATISEIYAGTNASAGSRVDRLDTYVSFTQDQPTYLEYSPSADVDYINIVNPSNYGVVVEVYNLMDASDIYYTQDTLSAVIPQMFGAKGDGSTDDTTAINNAILFAYNNGIKNVVIPPSSAEYIITQINLKGGVNLIGNGGILKVKSNYAADSSTNYYVIYSTEGNVTIDGIEIHGNSANNTLYNVCDLITIMGDNNIIKNCVIKDAIDSAIMVSQCTNSCVICNIIDTSRDSGIYINGANCYDNIIDNNILISCGNGGISLKRACHKIVISKNFIDETSVAGASGIALVNVDSETDAGFYCTIIGNRIYKADVGIYLYTTSGNVVTDNRIEAYLEKGIQITGTCVDNLIEGNIISQIDDGTLPTQTYNGGIIFLNNTGESERNIIGNNNVHSLYNPAISCFTTYAEGCSVSNNIIKANVFKSDNSFGVYALSALINNIVAENIVKSSRTETISSNNIIVNNIGLS